MTKTNDDFYFSGSFGALSAWPGTDNKVHLTYNCVSSLL